MYVVEVHCLHGDRFFVGADLFYFIFSVAYFYCIEGSSGGGGGGGGGGVRHVHFLGADNMQASTCTDRTSLIYLYAIAPSLASYCHNISARFSGPWDGSYREFLPAELCS